MNVEPVALNIRRLIFFHHRNQREAAQLLGVSEHTVSRWLTGRTRPDSQALMRIAELYAINPYRLGASPVEFAKDLADAERMEQAERRLDKSHRGKLWKPWRGKRLHESLK